MPAALLVPLLPLLTVLIVLIGSAHSRRARARVAAWPMGAAFCAAIATLYIVATQGPISVRFYDSGSLASIAFPIGFHYRPAERGDDGLDLGGRHHHLTLFRRVPVSGPRHETRFLSLIGFTTFVLLCMVSSAQSRDAVRVLAAPELLCFIVGSQSCAMRPRWKAPLERLRFCASAMWHFSAGIVLAHSSYGTLEFHALFAKQLTRRSSLSPLPGWEMSGATAVTLLMFIGA